MDWLHILMIIVIIGTSISLYFASRSYYRMRTLFLCQYFCKLSTRKLSTRKLSTRIYKRPRVTPLFSPDGVKWYELNKAYLDTEPVLKDIPNSAQPRVVLVESNVNDTAYKIGSWKNK